jgi:hypothetical protein
VLGCVGRGLFADLVEGVQGGDQAEALAGGHLRDDGGDLVAPPGGDVVDDLLSGGGEAQQRFATVGGVGPALCQSGGGEPIGKRDVAFGEFVVSP